MKFTVRFQVSMAATILLIIVALTAATLGSVYYASSRAAEETAGKLFRAAAQRAFERIDSQMGRTLALAGLGAAKPAAAAGRADGLDAPELPFVFTALAEDASLYALYYGRDDGSFLQVIATRGDARVLAAHKAPPGTEWIIRSITGAGAERAQTWTFLDGRRGSLGVAVDSQPGYDPRQRPWYAAAAASDRAELSPAYIFNSLGEPGITASRRFAGGVFGVDITLSGLDRFIREQVVSANGGIVLADATGRVLAMTDTLAPSRPMLSALGDIDQPLVKAVARLGGQATSDDLIAVKQDGLRLMLYRAEWKVAERPGIAIAVVAPTEDFVGHIRAMQARILLAALACLVVFLPAVIILARRMAARVRGLADDAMRVRDMDFSGPPPTPSHIVEFNELGDAFGLMKVNLSTKATALKESQEKLARLVDLGIAMSSERDSHRLMEMVLLGAKELTNADGGTLYIRGEDEKLHFQILRNDTLKVALGGSSGNPVSIPPVAMFDAEGRPNHNNVVSHAVHQQETVIIDDAYDSTEFDFSGTKVFDERNGYRSKSFMTVPLKPRGGDVIGALQLINARPPGSDAVVPFSPEVQRFVEALAAQAATALYNRELLSAQERLMDAMIQLIAGAIDAKSPYTGGHCERVPELALMLAEEATKRTDGPLAEFRFETDDEWREFRIGAWLHDCGKVVMPEHIVDKATKLETIYDRIHEVRMRYEVLLRDADIERLEAIAAGAAPADADAACATKKAKLLEDFAFIAECNIGGEFMAPDKVERLKGIAATTWLRHIDDRLGIGHEELKRHGDGAPPELPAVETVLADKPFHVIRRGDGSVNRAYENLGFQVKVPDALYNLGEVYNLSVGRGTLTEEDRFKIIEHIMQTISMLERLPFPKNLKRVPEYAGTHHETLIGSGYPRKLGKDELSIPSRIMAIADIFEALTASDRPYKKAKTLSESVKILSFFKKDGHIDADLFDLFLTSGVYRRYAERFLGPDQIDEVDVASYVTAA